MNTTQLLVRKVLENHDRFEWSMQGFGMLRTYLSKQVRLHIWHSAFKVPNVSTIHDHPWDFESTVVVGSLVNRIYTRRGSQADPTHTMGRIRCGVGGGLVRAEHTGKALEEPVRLDVISERRYSAGERYDEEAELLHESLPEDGTVTLVSRRFRQDTEHARVCYPLGTPWVSAEPRPATRSEILTCVGAALVRLEGVTR